MVTRRILAALVGGWLLSGGALAQSNLGELLDSGGKVLTKDEVLATLRGATITGPSASGGEWNLEMKDNGTMSGWLVNATGKRANVYGTWTVDDSGKICRDFTIRFYGDTQQKDCFNFYRLGDQYYVPATSSDERSVGLLKRTVKR